MKDIPLDAALRELDGLKADHNLHNRDFLLTWEHTPAELRSILLTARILRALHDAGRSVRAFDTGLAVSIFRDQSTRTRFSFASAASALGLTVSDLDETKSQIAHGETVRETAVMISFNSCGVNTRSCSVHLAIWSLMKSRASSAVRMQEFLLASASMGTLMASPTPRFILIVGMNSSSCCLVFTLTVDGRTITPVSAMMGWNVSAKIQLVNTILRIHYRLLQA